MSNRFIRDPREVVKVGDVVQVKVISVEVETKRIGLSMKALLPTMTRHRKKPRRQPARPAQAAPAADATGGAETAAPAASAAPQPNDAETRAPRGDARPQRQHRPPHRRGDGRPRRRDARPRNDRTPAVKEDVQADRATPAQQPQEAVPVPAVPEPTLQEKIAILQSKFRGIN